MRKSENIVYVITDENLSEWLEQLNRDRRNRFAEF